MKREKKKPNIAAMALSSNLFRKRIVKAQKGKGSYSRKEKGRESALYRIMNLYSNMILQKLSSKRKMQNSEFSC